MAGPIEILICAGAFSLVGVYLYIVHRFIRAGEEAPSSPVIDAEQTRAGARTTSTLAAAH